MELGQKLSQADLKHKLLKNAQHQAQKVINMIPRLQDLEQRLNMISSTQVNNLFYHRFHHLDVDAASEMRG